MTPLFVFKFKQRRDAREEPGEVPDRVDRILVRVKHAMVASIVAVNLILPVALFVHARPKWWRGFMGEESPINWFSSMQCAVLAGMTAALFLVSRLGRVAGSDPTRRSWPWLVTAAGFLLLSIDEQFGFHEQAPHLIFKPLDLFTNIPGIKPGDVLLPLLAVAGVFLAWFLLDDLRRSRISGVLFLIALALALLVTIQDVSSSPVFMQRVVRRVQIVAEETGEIWAQALFAIATVTLLFGKLRALLSAISAPRASGSAPSRR